MNYSKKKKMLNRTHISCVCVCVNVCM